MISPRMSRPLKVLLTVGAAVAIGALTSACGTQKIALSRSNPLYRGAVLFNQRCSGCHTLSYAATHGSAANVRTAQYNNGPNFDQRCERPVTRVLYAIENGGFSGAVMPQNVVVGQDAIDVARFVATYAGRKAPNVPGVVPCLQEPVGTIPALSGAGSAAATAQATQVSGTQKGTSGKVRPSKRKGGRNGKPASTGQGQGTSAQ